MRAEYGDDATLVEAWRRGDAEAVQLVILLHAPAMTRVALALCQRAEDAEEVVQDALLQSWRSLATFDSARGTLRAWLLGVTANRARQVRRGLARYGGFLARLQREPYEATGPAPASGDLAYARGRLAALPARERQAFVLVEIEELTSTEAGHVMRIAAATVRVLVARARTRLKQGTTVSPARPATVEGTGR